MGSNPTLPAKNPCGELASGHGTRGISVKKYTARAQRHKYCDLKSRRSIVVVVLQPCIDGRHVISPIGSKLSEISVGSRNE